jgi:hypothetical protein
MLRFSLVPAAVIYFQTKPTTGCVLSYPVSCRAPGPLQLFVSNSSELCGASWSQLKHAAAGPGAGSGYDSSPAFVLPYTFGGPVRVSAVPRIVVGCSRVYLCMLADGVHGQEGLALAVTSALPLYCHTAWGRGLYGQMQGSRL